MRSMERRLFWKSIEAYQAEIVPRQRKRAMAKVKSIERERLTCASYSKRSMGIGIPGETGGGASWFFKTEGRDLDESDVAVLHRFIHLWNAAIGMTTEEAAARLTEHRNSEVTSTGR